VCADRADFDPGGDVASLTDAALLVVVTGSIAVAFAVYAFELVVNAHRGDDGVICHGDAKPHDRCFADIVATDDAELLAYIAHRGRWRVWHRLRDLIARMEGRMAKVPEELIAAVRCYNGEIKHCKPGRARAKRRPRDPLLIQAEERWKSRRQERREQREARPPQVAISRQQD
jgi:hypothetical protein